MSSPPTHLPRRSAAITAAAALALTMSAVAPAGAQPGSAAISAPVIADAFVRDGEYADQNYGSHSQLQWKSGAAGFARQSYLSFDVSGLTEADAATLWLHGRVSGGASGEYPDAVVNEIHRVDPASWTESSITWSNAPALEGEPAAEFTFDTAENTSNAWHAVDLTALVAEAVAEDEEILSIALVRPVSSGPMPQMNSRESGYAPVLEVGEATETEPEPPVEGPVRSELYPEDWTPGMADAEGRFLHDFSHAGYRYGADVPATLPGVVLDPVTLGADPTGATDSTAAIQAAIDAVGAAGGGVVQLPAGTFTVSRTDESRAVLHIPHDGVMLRGAGAARTRVQTSTADGLRQAAVILVGPEKAQWQSWHDSEAQQTEAAVPLTRDVTEPTRTLHVADAGAFAPGDQVILKADITSEWLEEHPVLPGQQWLPTTFRALVYQRQITAVDATAGTVEINIPTRYAMLLRDGVRLHQHHRPTVGSGVADLAIGMRQSDLPHSSGTDHNREGTQGHQAHGASAIAFNNAVDGFVDGVRSFRPDANPDDVHVLSNGIYIWYARSITVQDTDMRRAQYLGEGGNGYLYHLMGSDNLVRDSYAEKGRHNYLVQAVQGTGNVILDSHSVDATHALELHRHLGVANLFDNVSVDRDSFEMQYRTSSTHAHSGTESVMWNISGENCTRGRLAVSQQFGWGYVIGTSGEGACAVVENPGGQFTEPRDWLEFIGAGEHLEPRSLYLDQRDRRLASVGDPTLPPTEPTVSPTPTPTETPMPSPGPTVTVTVTPQPAVGRDLYETPGFHESAGRRWMTVCEPYSQTHRCHTFIWGTQVQAAGEQFVQTTGWVFNNLTYVASPRALWAGNPLGNSGTWTGTDGRTWRTECDSEVSGGNGCRTYVTASVIQASASGYRLAVVEVFNSLVRFS